MKKEKILKQGQKVIYWAPYIKPSTATVEELLQDDEIALLSNKVRINTHLNKKGYFTRTDRKEGYALPYNDVTAPIIEAANFYHQLDFSSIQAKMKEVFAALPNPEAINKILQVKRLINKINKVLE